MLYILKVHYFLLLTNIPLDYISQFYTSCFLLVIISKTAISLHIKLLCEHKLTLSLLIHMVSLFLTSEETAKLFSNVVELCCFYISKIRSTYFLYFFVAVYFFGTVYFYISSILRDVLWLYMEVLILCFPNIFHGSICHLYIFFNKVKMK